MKEPNLEPGRSRALGHMATTAVLVVGLAGLAGCGGGDEPDELNGGPGTVTMIVSRSLESHPTPAAARLDSTR